MATLIPTCILAAAAIAPKPVALEPQRVRIVSDCGAITLFDPHPNSKSVVLTLFAGAKECPESPVSHGMRHLLEHLLVKGTTRNLAFKLESASWTITAETYRDFMTLRLEGPASSVKIAFAALEELFDPPAWTREEIQGELEVLRQELALQSADTRLMNLAWLQAFGPTGLDPGGNLDVMAASTNESLHSLFRKQFGARNLVLSIAGPQGIVGLEALAEKIWSLAPPSGKANWGWRTGSGRGVVRGDFGEAIYSVAPGYSNPLTAWSLAAAMAVAAEADDRFVAYTPSLQAGLIIVGSAKSAGIQASLGPLRRNPSNYAGRAKSLALAWFDKNWRSARDRSWWNGAFQVQAVGGNPQILRENLEAMTAEDFASGLARLSSDPIGAKK